MKLVELYRKPHEILEVAWSCQRQALKDLGVALELVDCTGLPLAAAKARVAQAAGSAWLVRDTFFLQLDLPGTVYVDLALPCELGTTSPLRAKLQKARRVFAYSALVERSVREAGMGRVTVLPGPHMESWESPIPEKVTVGVLKTSSDAQRVLVELMSYRATKDFVFDVVSPMPAKGALKVATNLDAADACTVVLAPMDFGDTGEPHLGAILALGARKGLITSRNDALSAMGFPMGSFIHVLKYSPRSYVSAIDVFMHNPRPFLEWPHKAGADYTRLPRFLHKDMLGLEAAA